MAQSISNIKLNNHTGLACTCVNKDPIDLLFWVAKAKAGELIDTRQ